MQLRYPLKKADGAAKLVLIGMALCHTANKPEGAEGVKAKAAVFPHNPGVAFCSCFADGPGICILFCAIRIKQKHLLAPGQRFGYIQQGFVKLGIVDAGSKPNEGITGKVGAGVLRHVYGRYVIFPRNGVY